MEDTLESFKDSDVKLLYDSYDDKDHWHTGCRDISLADSLKMAPAACSLTGIGRAIDDVIGTKLADLVPGRDSCIGTWGALYPRQMRSHVTEITGAAYSSYRAMHMASHTIGTMSYNVSTKGKMQHAFPVVSTCF